MALVVHSVESLRDIAADLQSMIERIEGVTSRMELNQIRQLRLDGQRTQVNARLAIHHFLSGAEDACRASIAESELGQEEKNGGP